MEAQRFPEDYQGILAGAPAISMTHLLAAAVYNLQVPALTNPASYIPASKIPAISAAVLTACDALDGVKDGILNDPRQCRFDPSALRCRGAESDDCLNSAQVAQLKSIYTGLRNAKGEQLFPGYMPGGEEGESGWGQLLGSDPGEGYISIFGLNFFRYMVFENSAWDYRMVNAERAVQIADERTAQTVNATDPDLSRFKARGGKLILYQGWSDPYIPGLSTVNYYDSVVAKQGMQETEGFARLYMVPGMQHCFAGPGTHSFGQFSPTSSQVSADSDPRHNISRALEHWVEQGTPPGPIIATKYVDDLNPAQGVKMTRPLCPYPQVAKYKGTGNTNEASNFVCAKASNQP
jgi:feruloyl esterase